MATGVFKVRLADGSWKELTIGAGGGGASAFIDLTDVPAAYAGAGGKVVAVKADVSGLEFITAPATGEPALGNPATTGFVLSSTDAGARSWVAQSGGGFATNFFATMSGNQDIAPTSWTKVTFDTAGTDDNTEWDAVNAQWTCKEAGTYLLHATLRYTANSTGMRGVCAYLNTAILDKTVESFWTNGAAITTRAVTCIPLVLGVGDDIEIYTYHNSSTNPLAIVASGCSWSMHRIH